MKRARLRCAHFNEDKRYLVVRFQLERFIEVDEGLRRFALLQQHNA